jgi:hypothetical protein
MTTTNHRVIESRKKLRSMSLEAIRTLCDFLISELGESNTELESKALSALQSENYDLAKHYCLCDPCNPYLAAISCIASAYRSPMVADSVLRDASRHTAEIAKKRSERRIAEQFQQVLEGV